MAKGKYHEWLQEDKLNILRSWARKGLTDAEIAKRIGIQRPTLYDWKNKYPNISDALKKGKEIYDNEVEESLHKSTLGYFIEEEKTLVQKIGDKEVIKKEKIKKWIPPNVTAQIFWLKCRKKEEWQENKDRLDIEEQKQRILKMEEELKLLSGNEDSSSCKINEFLESTKKNIEEVKEVFEDDD